MRIVWFLAVSFTAGENGLVLERDLTDQCTQSGRDISCLDIKMTLALGVCDAILSHSSHP